MPVDTAHPITLAIIGCGMMGSAIASGILETMNGNGTDVETRVKRVIACVQSEASVERLGQQFSQYLDSNSKHLDIFRNRNVEAMQEADVVLLACKPYMAAEVLGQAGVAEAVREKLIISVLSGVSPDQIRRMILTTRITTTTTESERESEITTKSERERAKEKEDYVVYVTRATPNIAAGYGQSMTVLDGTAGLLPEMLETTRWILDRIGVTETISSDVAAVGATLAGAAPAFLSVALDGLLDGAVSEGLRRPAAKRMLIQVLAGLVEVLRKDDNLENLRQAISSPRGTTIQGLLTLEESRARFAFSKAIVAATARFKSIGEETEQKL